MDNLSLFYLIHNLAGQNPLWDFLMVFAADYLIYVMVIFIFVAAFKGGPKEIKALLLIIFSIPIAILLISLIHLFIHESRPFVALHFTALVKESANAAFPSRHATIAAVVAFSYVHFKSKLALPFLLTMVWIGLARVFVGVHYPQDILGGFLVGAIALVITLQLKKALKYLLR